MRVVFESTCAPSVALRFLLFIQCIITKFIYLPFAIDLIRQSLTHSCPLCRVARRAALSDKIMEYPVLSPQLSNREFKSAIAILTLLPLLLAFWAFTFTFTFTIGTILQSNLLSFQIHNFPLFDTINTRWSVISRIFPLRTLMINISVQL